MASKVGRVGKKISQAVRGSRAPVNSLMYFCCGVQKKGPGKPLRITQSRIEETPKNLGNLIKEERMARCALALLFVCAAFAAMPENLKEEEGMVRRSPLLE